MALHKGAVTPWQCSYRNVVLSCSWYLSTLHLCLQAFQHQSSADKMLTLLWPSYLHKETSNTGKAASLYFHHSGADATAFWEKDVNTMAAGVSDPSITMSTTVMVTTMYDKSMGWCKKDVTPVRYQWIYIFLALTHQYESLSFLWSHLLSRPPQCKDMRENANSVSEKTYLICEDWK